MCHASPQWTETLPLVLLGMRSSWKEDLQSSPAELVYGETLRLPGQFLSTDDSFTTADITQYASRLQSHMAKLRPRPTSWHSSSTSPFYIPRDLSTSSHVFLRQDHVRGALQPPYAGPYKVIERQPKFFTLDVKGKTVSVSIDRLKPAYTEKDDPNLVMEQPNSQPTIARTAERQTRSGRKVRFPDFYRP
ncbi:uncharacterized protein LOC125490436 [Plutella xylostella]|uniref:uncharacterized protein LOC125490436 n=1 Tax=Plutella xylostella TaxID=51655 RepID=UPI002032A9B7|nr:uncharacterized protein LOC125490436 [Plutella xylostella]